MRGGRDIFFSFYWSITYGSSSIWCYWKRRYRRKKGNIVIILYGSGCSWFLMRKLSYSFLVVSVDVLVNGWCYVIYLTKEMKMTQFIVIFISDMNQHKRTFYASRCSCLNTMHLIFFTINSVPIYLCYSKYKHHEFSNLRHSND